MTVRNTAYSGGTEDPHSSDLRQCPTLRRLSEVTLGEKMDSNHYLWLLGWRTPLEGASYGIHKPAFFLLNYRHTCCPLSGRNLKSR